MRQMNRRCPVQGAITIPLGMRPILIGLPGVPVAVATGVTMVLLAELSVAIRSLCRPGLLMAFAACVGYSGRRGTLCRPV
jgi:hypothetical protein